MTVLLLAAIVAVVGSHLLTRSVQEVKLATRSYYMSAAMNLAEAGAEDAIWAENNSYFSSAYLGSTYGWSTATDGTGALVKIVTTGLALAQGTGEIYIRIDNPSASTPIIYSLGVVRLINQPPIVKQLRVILIRRALWPNAIVAKGSVTFRGNQISVDSYDSALGAWNATTNRSDHGTVATNVATTGGASINNADIYGAVATGGAQPVVGTNGSITDSTTPGGVDVDPSLIRTDFNYNILDTILPSATPIVISDIDNNLTLPRSGDTPAANGRYVYRTSDVDLNNEVLTISGPVDLIVTDDVSVSGGSGGMVVTSGGTNSLNLYVAGDLSLSGQGGINYTNDPKKMKFYGSRSTAYAASHGLQEFSLSGNSAYVGVVYAPNAAITLSGSGSTGVFNGAVIGGTVEFSGNYNFHYDTQLLSFLSDQSFRPSGWLELTEIPGSGAALARDNRQPFNAVF